MTTCLRKTVKLFLFLSVLFVFAYRAHAQDSLMNCRSRISFVSENDNYTLKLNDRYYTNGLMIRFSHAISTRPATVAIKKIWNAEIGQMIFTPYYIGRNYQATLDRPYTGFLYAKGGITTLLPKENVWRWSITAGVIGKAAKGEEVQETYHKDLGLVRPRGWETQLRSEAGLNVQASYYRHLVKPTGAKRTFDAFFKSGATAGTTFTQFSGGFLFRLGAVEAPAESAWWDADIKPRGNKISSRDYELFFYFEPSLTCQVYNATVQGGLFTKEKNTFTTDIQPVFYSHNFGIMFTQRRCTAQLGFTYKTKEARTMLTHENYGTIALGFRL